MTVRVEIWSIQELLEVCDRINEQPKYQRGAVWKDSKRAILIDSILRGIDIPKLYLRKLNAGAYDYEVADGQQRLTAIQRFASGDLKLLKEENNGVDLGHIGKSIVGGLNFEDLPETLQKSFRSYKLTVAVVEDASHTEIRTLFSRLQLGERLNPAEKRNAVISRLGIQLENIALNHSFFANSKIPRERYKHQDYLANAHALLHYNNAYNLKAPLLYGMYRDPKSACTGATETRIILVLDKLREIDSYSKRRIVNKYTFLDLFWLLWSHSGDVKRIKAKEFAEAYDNWESDRLKAMKGNLRDLISKANITPRNRHLYDYIIAFTSYAGYVDRINSRHTVLGKVFKHLI
jgi:hypothetical protein